MGTKKQRKALCFGLIFAIAMALVIFDEERTPQSMELAQSLGGVVIQVTGTVIEEESEIPTSTGKSRFWPSR